MSSFSYKYYTTVCEVCIPSSVVIKCNDTFLQQMCNIFRHLYYFHYLFVWNPSNVLRRNSLGYMRLYAVGGYNDSIGFYHTMTFYTRKK